MIPAMMNGLTGLNTHAQGMTIVSNDIANVNSVGYKQEEITFQELLERMGTGVSAITPNFSNGSLAQTTISSNLAISGSGFFAVADPAAAASSLHYTRAGDFVMAYDATSSLTYLTTPTGERLRGVMGANPDATGVDPTALVDIALPAGTTSFTIDTDGRIMASIAGATPQVIGRVALVSFANNYALEPLQNGQYAATADAGVLTLANPGSSGTGMVYQGYIEHSNVDLAREFTDMILIQRGFQANSRSITTSDEMLQEVLTLKR
jgi:flagellar hook protein FlgE